MELKHPKTYKNAVQIQEWKLQRKRELAMEVDEAFVPTAQRLQEMFGWRDRSYQISPDFVPTRVENAV